MKWLSNILKGASLTTALFIFQACYGTPPGFEDDFTPVSFKVVSAEDKSPIKDVEVSMQYGSQEMDRWQSLGFTGQSGDFGVELRFFEQEEIAFRFQDASDIYESKDTTFKQLSPELIEIQLKKKSE